MKSIYHVFALIIFIALTLTGCVQKKSEPGEVNVYSHRHYDSDKILFEQFTEQTGIKVNVVKAKADQLIERLKKEGENSPADVLMTVDVGRLTRAKDASLLQAFPDTGMLDNLPKHLVDEDSQWVALTKRARVVVYHKDRVEADELPDYEDLSDPKYQGRIITRSSTNIYNQSLIASILVHNGAEATETWANGLVSNFARDPKGNDRAQMRALAAGVADFAIVNTYYLGLLFAGPEVDKEIAAQLKIHFPNQSGRGTHINVSGAGITKSAKNIENAQKLISFLLSPTAQKIFAEVNYEYPILEGVEASRLVKSWGDFKEDTVSLNSVGAKGAEALKLADRAGWK
ncbi:MAG: Fe(3+) ABC transporter substrate-binding protein [Verrucomicrobiota bacterium]